MILQKIQTHIPTNFLVKKGEEKKFFLNECETCHITLLEKAKLTAVLLLTSGFFDMKKISIHLKGNGSQAKLLCIIIGREEKKFPFETVMEHTGRDTEAEIVVRNVLFDASMVDYKGNLVIRPGACKTKSFVAHHSLLLSKEAKVHTLPSLEIEADDVKAGHAATSGNIEEESLFYLMSRGLSRAEAEKMLIQGFLTAGVEKIADDGVRSVIAKNVQRALCNITVIPDSTHGAKRSAPRNNHSRSEYLTTK